MPNRKRSVRSKEFSSRYKKRGRTITRTFRISQELDDILYEEAEVQGVSVNSLVNKILQKYVLFDRWGDKEGSMSVTQQMFRRIQEEVTEEILARAGAASGPLDMIDVMSMMGLPLNYDSFVYLLLNHYGKFSRWFSCFHHPQRGSDVFHLQHNFGHGWSIYLKNYFLSALSALKKTKVQVKVYDFAVNIKVTHPLIQQ